MMKYCPAPYLWISLLWTAILFRLFFVVHHERHKVVLINLCAVTLLVGIAEFYFWAPFSVKIRAEGDMWLPTQYVRNDITGYQPPHNAKEVKGKKYYGKEVVYDMSFSTDKHGLRNSYPKNPQATESILFFGCSLTFGDGLNDEETLPFQLGAKANKRFNTYNFAYSGYGAHQMLALLEQDAISQVVKEKPSYAFYTAIPGHIARSAGLQSWPITDHDPKYELDQNGKIYYVGHFDDEQAVTRPLKRRILAHLSNSYILKRVYPPFGFNQKRLQDEHDLKRYVKIVARSRDLFEAKYPGAEFHVILWNLFDSVSNEAVFNKLYAELQAEHLRVHVVKDILPGYVQNDPKYQILHDGHPTSYSNQLISEYIATNVMAG